jgi:hypothetical protein
VTETDQVVPAARPPVVAAGQPGPRAAVEAIAPERVGALTTEQLARVVRLLKASDGVELKVSVPDADRRSAVSALDMDPLDAQIRQVVFFDTPDLLLDRHGVIVRARRVQGKAGDTIVKLRPLEPQQLAASTRAAPAFGVEIDALPGGFVCSGRMKTKVDNAAVRDAIAGRLPVRKLFTKEQRDLYAGHAPDGVRLDDLSVLGPINVLKLKLTPVSFPRPVVAELWLYPDGSRLLELSIKCQPTEAFEAAAESRRFLSAHGIDLVTEQQTKTRTALDYFASELVGGM